VSALVEQRGAAYAVRSTRFAALVVVADSATRRGVVRVLQLVGAVEVTEAASIGEARARTRGLPPRELVVVDLSLPDGSGVALFGELRAAGWHRGVVLTSDADPFSVRAALAADVRGFVVDQTRDGRPHVRPTAPLPPGVESLSAREIEVLDLVAGGRSNRDIGEVLHLSALTVKSHLARIARKLGTGDRAEMVAVSLRAGVIR